MLITWTRLQRIFNEKTKTDLVFEFDLNSRKFENLTQFKG
jgi:hypothetical protein